MKFLRGIFTRAVACSSLLSLLAAPVLATTRYISPTGSATYANATSAGTPMSLSTANNGATAGDSLVMAVGTYSDPIQPHANGTVTNWIVYAGASSNPTGVSVTSIYFGGSSTSQNVIWGDYVRVRWVATVGEIGQNVHLRSGGFYVCHNDQAIKVQGGASLNISGWDSMFDSLSVTALNGRITLEPHVSTYPFFDTQIKNVTLKNSNFNFTNSQGGTSNQYFFEGRPLKYCAILNNNFTFTSTNTNTNSYLAFAQFYLTQYTNINDNTFNIIDNSTTDGTKLVFSFRDSTNHNQVFRNTWNVSGSATKPPTFYASNGGSFPTSRSVRDNRFEGNTIKTSNGQFSAFYYENGASKDTVRFNVIATSRSMPAFATNTSVRFDSVLFAHNTLYAANGLVAFFDTTTANTGSKLVSNIFYGTSANSVGSPTIVTTTSVGLDSSGVFFNRGGASGQAIKLAGAAPKAPAAAANYGIAQKAVWNTPKFTDSTYAGLNTVLGASSPADDDNLHDGFAGALGVVTADVTAPATTSDLTVKNIGSQQITLTWTSAGDDGATGVPAKYKIYAKTVSCPLSAFGTGATDSSIIATGSPAGTSMQSTFTGLSNGTAYNFVVVTVDDANNFSAVGNCVSATPNQAGITIVGTQKIPNFNTCGIKAFVAGDNDSNAVLRLFYKPFGEGGTLEITPEAASYDSGVVMYRRIGSTVHVGKLFWLQPGTTYQFYIEGIDASGNYSTAPDTFTTRTGTVSVKGPLFYVSPSGSGSACTKGAPCATIQTAITALLNAPSQGRGGGIVLAPGVYRQNIQTGSGNAATPDSFYTLTSDLTNPDSTIIDGSRDTVLTWTATGVDSIYKAPYPNGKFMSNVIVGWGEKLHRCECMDELIQNHGWTSSPPGNCPSSNTAWSLNNGWFWQNDTLYVQRDGGATPGSTNMHLGGLDNLLWIQKRYWKIANLTFRFSGRDTAGNGAGFAIRIGAGQGEGATTRGTGTFIDSCKFIGLQKDPIVITDLGSDSVVVQNCFFDGLTIGNWPYGASKSRSEEHAAISNNGGGSVVVRNNTITRVFNGVGTFGSVADSTCGEMMDVHDNNISHLADDAIEYDAMHGINASAWKNTIYDCNYGVSLAPVWTGPAYIIYNSIRNSKSGGIKFGDGAVSPASLGHVLIAHNTITSSGGTHSAVRWTGGICVRKQFRNNILVGYGSADYVIVSTALNADTTKLFTNDFNYDVLDSVTAGALVRFKRPANTSIANYTFLTVRDSLGWEKNGRRGALAFRDSANGDLRLQITSTAIDAGQRIPGINTPPGAPPTTGNAPDAGAQEFLPAPVVPSTFGRSRSGLHRPVEFWDKP